ncbi:MAG: histidine kinase [Nocardioides sp.]
MIRFALGTLAVLAVLLCAAFWISSHMARSEMLRESRERSQALAKFVVAPLMSSGVAPNPTDRAALDERLGIRIEDGSIVRAKIWSRDGTVLWSDEKSLVGQRFPLGDEASELLGTRRAQAEVSALTRAEHALERAEGPLIEVYAATTAGDGEPILFEAYFPAEEIQRDSRTLVLALVGLSVAILVLFAAASWPLALSLARRVERVTERNARLVGHTLRASDLERRRLSENLHDDVIPDLAGVGYLLPVIDQSLAAGDHAAVRRHLDRLGEIVHRDVVALRSALVDIHPPDLVRDGLGAALDDLADETRSRGRRVDLHLPTFEPPPEVSQLVYRAVREGLHNVNQHSRAERVLVRVTMWSGGLQVLVEDDGVGPPASTASADHLGLQLLDETMRDLDGLVVLEQSTLGGAQLRVEVPLPLVTG